MSNRKGLAIILSAPSGGGKSSIARQLLKQDANLILSVSVTTRPKRPNDVEGKNYFFRSKDEFRAMIDNGELLEYSEIYGNFYGIPRDFVEQQLALGHDILFDINWQGAAKLKKLRQNVASIFILPPNLEELRKRLEARNQDDKAQIDLRMAMAADEIRHAVDYDHVIVNDDFQHSVDAIHRIIVAKRKLR